MVTGIQEFLEEQFLSGRIVRGKDDDDDERREGKPRKPTVEIFEKYHAFRQFYQLSSDPTQQLIQILELRHLFETQFWAQLARAEGVSDIIFQTHGRVSFANS